MRSLLECVPCWWVCVWVFIHSSDCIIGRELIDRSIDRCRNMCGNNRESGLLSPIRLCCCGCEIECDWLRFNEQTHFCLTGQSEWKFLPRNQIMVPGEIRPRDNVRLGVDTTDGRSVELVSCCERARGRKVYGESFSFTRGRKLRMIYWHLDKKIDS